MGNLLIVDDEPDILEGLEELFKYESGLDIDVSTAQTAGDAVKLLEKKKYDVVMTDIKMPGMSGIELFYVIKENWPKCRVIFLTGYRDFDDLYEIMQNKDVRYLLKSEEYDVLIQNVADAFQEIEDMMRCEKEESQKQKEVQQAQSILQRNFMKEYLSGRKEVKNLQNELVKYEIPLSEKENLFIFLMKLDTYQKNQEKTEIETEGILKSVIDEFTPLRIKSYLYRDDEQYFLLFFQPKQWSTESVPARTWNRLYTNLKGALEYIQEKLLASQNISVSFVTCDERCFLTDASAYRSRLKQEAIRNIGNGMQKIITAKALLPMGDVEQIPINMQLQVKKLEETLEAKNPGEFLQLSQKLTQRIAGEQNHNGEEAAELYYSIALLLLRYININHLRQKIENDIHLEALINIEYHAGRAEAAGYLNQIADRIATELEIEKRSRTMDVLEKVTMYIEDHIGEDLTLTRLADISYLNPSYLSRIFKQKYGNSLTEYISSRRIQEAKKQLAETTKKIHDIALDVGYLSVPSFNRVFKKMVGMSPVEYRDCYGVKNNEL